MARYSKMEKFRTQIREYLDIGVSIRSAQRFINSQLPEEAKISYTAFYHYCKTHILKWNKVIKRVFSFGYIIYIYIYLVYLFVLEYKSV